MKKSRSLQIDDNAAAVGKRHMFSPAGSVCISLGAVVLDRPDQTGRFIVKDLAGGWAYLVADGEGDNRFRGQGCCDGGLDVALRCAFLAAVHRVPDCGHFRILVETRQAHRAMVRFASDDFSVIDAIAGRRVEIMTRPEELSSFQVRSAAEQAASVALKERERTEWQTAAALLVEADPALADLVGEPDSQSNQTARRRAWTGRPAERDALTGPVIKRDMAPAAPGAVQRLVRPLMQGFHDGLAAAGVMAPRRAEGKIARATVQTDLGDVGV